eukprot:9718919-Heterocapsa_arctica.AAC.1
MMYWHTTEQRWVIGPSTMFVIYAGKEDRVLLNPRLGQGRLAFCAAAHLFNIKKPPRVGQSWL